jgi:hypothetical protein
MTFEAVQMGSGTTDANAINESPSNQGGAGNNVNYLTDGQTIRRGSDVQLEDCEAIAGPYLYPAKVKVLFRVNHSCSDLFGKINDDFGQFYSVAVSGSALTTGSDYTAPSEGVLTDSTVILFDDALARFEWTFGWFSKEKRLRF